MSHKGVVTSVTADGVSIELSDTGNCGGCHVASLCGKNRGSENVFVATSGAAEFKVGERVIVTATDRGAWIAVAVGLIAPAALLFAVVMGLLALGVGQGIAAIAGIVSLIPYFLIIYALRQRITRELTWSVAKEI